MSTAGTVPIPPERREKGHWIIEGMATQGRVIGALVMLVSDLIAQHMLPATQLPVGVVTGACGAIFLLWLLITSGRSGRVN